MGHVVDIHCHTFNADDLPGRGGTGASAKQRVMYGSDWYMLAALPEHEEFLDNYESLYRARFDDAATDDFLGGNALRFPGFDDAANKNAQRLRARYEEHRSLH